MTYWRADATNNKPVRAGAQLTFSKEYGAGEQLAPNDTFFVQWPDSSRTSGKVLSLGVNGRAMLEFKDAGRWWVRASTADNMSWTFEEKA